MLRLGLDQSLLGPCFRLVWTFFIEVITHSSRYIWLVLDSYYICPVYIPSTRICIKNLLHFLFLWVLLSCVVLSQIYRWCLPHLFSHCGLWDVALFFEELLHSSALLCLFVGCSNILFLRFPCMGFVLVLIFMMAFFHVLYKFGFFPRCLSPLCDISGVFLAPPRYFRWYSAYSPYMHWDAYRHFNGFLYIFHPSLFGIGCLPIHSLWLPINTWPTPLEPHCNFLWMSHQVGRSALL